MAKEKEKKLARILYVEQQKDAKEIATLIGVSEVTLSKWVNENNEQWKKERSARTSTPTARTDNIRQIINDLSEERINLSRQLKEAERNVDLEQQKVLRTSIAQTDDAVSKWNKTLETVDKENQVTLTTYLAVMEMLFDAMRKYDEKLFFQTVDFQDVHLNEVSLKFK